MVRTCAALCDLSLIVKARMQSCAEALQVKVRLMVNPYGVAGAASDPETVESNYHIGPVSAVRAANIDDLEGMVREPNVAADAAEVVGIASTDDMELKVLKPSMLTMGAGPASLTFAAHATFKTLQQAKPASSRAAAAALQDAAGMRSCIASAYRQRHAQGAAAPNGARGLPPAAYMQAKPSNGVVHENGFASRSHAGSGPRVSREKAFASEPPLRRSAVRLAVPAAGALGNSWHYRMIGAEQLAPGAAQPRRAGAAPVHGR